MNTSAVVEALDANRALVAKLQSLNDIFANEETNLLTKIQSLRRQMAMRRAQHAMKLLLPHSSVKDTILRRYEKNPRGTKKHAGVGSRSYIRQHHSFFTDEAERERKVGRPKKKKLKTLNGYDQELTKLQAASEPFPNADTVFLRAHSHEAFVASPSTTFSARERHVVKEFAEEFYMTHAPTVEMSLQVWNGIEKWQKLRRSRQLPIERSGCACKLWYDLHESPKLRLCAWTKEEDAALRRLATGEEDPALVNQWCDIAKHMPFPGRPPVHCLTRFQTALRADNAKSGFSAEEDDLIRQAVPIFGEKWNVIADLLDGRLSEQIRHRWQLTLAPGLRRGKFSVIEDRRLLLALRAYISHGQEFDVDDVAWNDICHHVPGRTQPALRDRYLNCLNPDLSFRKFTKKEDQTILARVQEWGVESARLWPRLAAELEGRTDAQVRRRWKSLDPVAYKKRSQALEQASTQQATSVFRRRSIHRHSSRITKTHTSRSSYNGRTVKDDQIQATRRGRRPQTNGP
ncbi:myb domain protein 4r1 [Plasmopara halstedii]|uniref:Myb domain protein 4r1 n=1 Tax=Plasmopara halstedii TaxID=4781 RepID=A0A0P1B2W5_PLAHL|nr:myb domain protein 4r1 [Plasmopara halstedii]CEG47782.1 myb domain protein 4r1 [Plasmopara halstedii]|eukprot:XP_024584151.1 myb domain protein 4r1 [Plasmopara halstedii]